MIDLEHALVDLAEHLDHPAGDQLAERVRERLAATTRRADRHRSRGRAVLAVAAVLLVILATIIAIAPARHAIADWLGIGAVQIRRSDAPPRAHPKTGNEVPGDPRTPPDPAGAKSLAVAQQSIEFTIAAPPIASAGKLTGVEVDTTVPGGIVALHYSRFTLVEVASPAGQPPSEPPPLGKRIGPETDVVDVAVNGTAGRWITGPHDVGYLDRTGEFRIDTARRSGPVLLWARGAITYRIEGLDSLADAQAIASTLR